MDVRRETRIVFATTMMGIGLIGLISGGFAAIWEPVQKTMPGREFLAYACALVALSCGAGLLFRRTATYCALALLLYLVVWTAMFKVPLIVQNPAVEVGYQSAGMNAVLIVAVWLLLHSFGKESDNRFVKIFLGHMPLRAAYALYGFALIAFGFSHFAYLQLTAPLIPVWLLWPLSWAYFTGCAYLLPGASLAAGILPRLGAMAAAVQITLITVFVWAPRVIAGGMDAFRWQETIFSIALTAGSWVIATSFEQAEPIVLLSIRKLWPNPAADQ